ncbi:MAG TPA: 4Fe-4S dicluster domain-containing protein [Spirochaetota bacterium]|jgi:molybdopterin-containing oxidoreductase family iron-sulfur binding subunit|nr:4Fe-4S dicluster domain-containing protein [Spirochaetota bacterium]HRS62138.1 4Fe-4S dicluster domain-containing protein [Spirochaetota bacterium]HRU66755.1 4Fe-4S dicluster domain-containing protein [Spirochaetota bacterium]
MIVKDSKMKRKWGMAIDLDKCTGCGACSLACNQENNMPIFEDDSDVPKRVAFLELMKVTNDRDAKFPDVKTAYLPKMCQQCEGNDTHGHKADPPCVSVCPAVATDVGDDGVVSQIWSRCIGCRYCQTACPYEARVFNWWKPEYEGTFKEGLNPEVSVASRGTIVKCTFCSHIWKRERDKAVAKGILDINAVTYTPACAAACPTGAIVFGDLNDPDSEISKLAKSDRAVRLNNAIDDQPEDKKKALMEKKQYPNPKVYYLTSQKWLRDMMRFKKNS